MSYQPIAFTIPQYDKVELAGWWLKAYAAGTTTPIELSLDSNGQVTTARIQLNNEGFPISSTGALVIPSVDQNYDLYCFPTAEEADDNDTTNALRFADNIGPRASTRQDSLTALLQAGGVFINDEQYFVAGFKSLGDGGGSTFYYSDSISKSEHNGITIIDTDKNIDDVDYFTPAISGTGALVSVDVSDVSVLRSGMCADSGVTDNSKAWIACCKYLSSGGSMFVPSAGEGNSYDIRQGGGMFAGKLRFEPNALIRNVANETVNFWYNTCIFVGSYFGFNVIGGINREVSYDIDNASIGDNEITLSEAPAAGTFNAGDVIYLLDANVYDGTDGRPTEFHVGSHITEVLEINGPVITLRDNIPIAITASDTESATVRIATNSLPTSRVGAPDTATLARNVTIENAQFESIVDSFSQVVHASSHESIIDCDYIKGSVLFGINPCSYSSLTCRNGLYHVRGVELAYHHSYVNLSDIKLTRTGIPANPRLISLPFGITEYGNNVSGSNIIINDYSWEGNLGNSAMGLFTPMNCFSNVTINGSQNNSLTIGVNAERAEFTTINNLNISGSERNGVILNSAKVKLHDLNISGIPETSKAIIVRDGAGNTALTDVTMAEGPQYVIEEENGISHTSNYSNIVSHLRQYPLIERNVRTIPGTGQNNFIATYSIPAGTSSRFQGWNVRFSGNIPASSTNRSKTIVLRTASSQGPATNISTLELSASQTGFFSVDIDFSKLMSHATCSFAARTSSVRGALRSDGIITNNFLTTGVVFQLFVNMSTSDTLNLRSFEVIPDDNYLDI